MRRNVNVENAVGHFLVTLDSAINKEVLQQPSQASKHACRKVIENYGGSVKLATMFLASYSVIDDGWDFTGIPIGIRGKYGDKLLATELNNRRVAIHNSVTAFGENLGWKGNVSNVNLGNDPRFKEFISYLSKQDKGERIKIVNFFAQLAADSIFISAPIPPLEPDVLTYGRSIYLFRQLLSLPTEGHIPQFLITALLAVHRRRNGVEIRTHHPHASDTYDETAGDIEEIRDGELIGAYEVTVRPDWVNRIHDFIGKMVRYSLKKYVIISSNVNSDVQFSNAKNLLDFTNDVGQDLAIVDINDFINVFTAELSAEEIRQSINYCFEMLNNPKLCGRPDIIQQYLDVVDKWIDEVGKNG